MDRLIQNTYWKGLICGFFFQVFNMLQLSNIFALPSRAMPQPFCKSGPTFWNHKRVRTSRLYKTRETKLRVTDS